MLSSVDDLARLKPARYYKVLNLNPDSRTKFQYLNAEPLNHDLHRYSSGVHVDDQGAALRGNDAIACNTHDDATTRRATASRSARVGCPP
jgi:hypothetical protein